MSAAPMPPPRPSMTQMRNLAISSKSEFFFELTVNYFRHHPLDIAAVDGRFLEDAGGEEDPSHPGHQEHGFDSRLQPAVHHGQLEFVLEVGERPQAPGNGPGVLSLGILHQQTVKG